MPESTLLLLLGVLTATAALTVALFVRWLVDRGQARVARRLRPADGDTGSPGELMIRQPPTHWAGRLNLAFDELVRRTGLDITPPRALLGMLALGVALSVALVLWRNDFALGALGLFLGTGAPLAILLLLQSRWRRQLQDQLPSALDLLVRGLRSGQSLEQGLAMVGERGAQPLAAEFRLCSNQINLGLPVPTAVDRAAQRIRLPDFDLLVTALKLYRETGGNLTLLLEQIAANARDRNQFRKQVQASTSLARVTAIFIGGVVPALLLYYLIMRPDYVSNFLASPEGLIAVLVTIVLEVVGILWTAWLLCTDY